MISRTPSRSITTSSSIFRCYKPQARKSSTASSSSNPFILTTQINQSNRQPFKNNIPITTTQPPSPTWKYGSGSNQKSNQNLRHLEIDPSTQPMIKNYKLLVSAIPRPISLISTVSNEGKRNLAPFSYFQIIDHDPPIFVVGFSARAGSGRLKDTRRNLVETGECVISIVSEDIIEAVNATSLDLPHGVSEWESAGLTGVPSSIVTPERPSEAIFSIEGKLLEMKELSYHNEKATGKATGGLAIIEAAKFWIREDALDEKGEVKLEVLRPLVGLGGSFYGRVSERFELPRSRLEDESGDEDNGLGRILKGVREE